MQTFAQIETVRATPSVNPRTVDLSPQSTDKDFAAYTARIDKAISHGMPGLLIDCEWSGPVDRFAHLLRLPDFDRRYPIAYIESGTESPIVILALKLRYSSDVVTVWHAKLFDGDTAIKILAWLTAAAGALG